jgi:hypothetical protein
MSSQSIDHDKELAEFFTDVGICAILSARPSPHRR